MPSLVLSRSYPHQKSGNKIVLMTHRLGKTVLYFSLAVGCLCLALVLWGPERHRKGHLSPQKCMTVACSWPKLSHFQPPFPPQCACKLGSADTSVSEHFLTAYGYFKLALCAGNIAKLMVGCLLEHCLVHATCLAKCCWKDPIYLSTLKEPSHASSPLPWSTHVTQRKGLWEVLHP